MEPYCFENLLGHEKAKTLLLEAAAKNKISHAYLFRGPEGVGKTRAALSFAAYINCKSPRENDACGSCTSCRKYSSGNHPDLIHIVPDGAAIKISQVRELKQQLAYPPLEAAVRVVVLEDVHTMRREAANSLLKTLEEPAPDNLLILIADLAGNILPTIISRCQVIPFGPLGHEDLARILMAEHEMERGQAIELASAAEGSLGRAKLLLEEDLLALRQEIVEQLLVMHSGQGETVEQVFRLTEKTAPLKENIFELLALLRLWFRDLILVASGTPAASVANGDMASSLEAAQKHWTPAQLHEKLRSLDRAEKLLLRNCNRGLVIETLFFDLI